ncbi:hypothetical protein KC221_26680, partial [Mycobacterium tuberculosis]|nr:hypothetical protein [Mycobacterium tuberculosis]
YEHALATLVGTPAPAFHIDPIPLQGTAPQIPVALPSDVIERRPVNTDRAVGNMWLLQDGPSAGERVVVDGFPRIKPGDKVRAVEV